MILCSCDSAWESKSEFYCTSATYSPSFFTLNQDLHSFLFMQSGDFITYAFTNIHYRIFCLPFNRVYKQISSDQWEAAEGKSLFHLEQRLLLGKQTAIPNTYRRLLGRSFQALHSKACWDSEVHKLKWERFRMDVGRNFFPKIAKEWHRLPRKVVYVWRCSRLTG